MPITSLALLSAKYIIANIFNLESFRYEEQVLTYPNLYPRRGKLVACTASIVGTKELADIALKAYAILNANVRFGWRAATNTASANAGH